MPLYEYRCDQCGEVFEVLQKFSDKPLSVHEKCGGTVQKLVSASALQFKGSGFYVNDYAKSGRGTPRDGKHGTDKSTEKSAGKGADKSQSDSSSKSSDTSSSNKSESSGSGKSDSPSSTTPTTTSSSDTK